LSRFQPTPAYRIFLDLLVKERQTRNVTQDELAGRLALSHTQIAAFENGQKQLDFVQTREWCLALGVTFLDFMVQLDREITAQIPDAFTAPAANAESEQEPKEGGAK
jgi:transcriptional regulator with XRE-family HTH domain